MTQVTMNDASSVEAAIFNMMAKRYQAGDMSAQSVNITATSVAHRPADPAANATAVVEAPSPAPTH